MSANDFINEVFSKEFADTKEIKPYYQKMSKIFDGMTETKKEKIRNSMCLEMLERAIK